MNPLLLNYHDACVYKSDLRLVESPTEWLNDACINFQMTRLQQRHNSSRASNGGGDGGTCGAPLLFLDPAVVSYMMHHCDEEDLACLGQSWGADMQRMFGDDPPGEEGGCRLCSIFVPINDHNAANSVAFQSVGGGNHWSMLLVVQLSCPKAGCKGRTFSVDQLLHFDSHGRCNATAAVAVGAKICQALSLNTSSNGVATPRNKVTLTHCKTPQQNNGHDCGIFTLGAAEALSVSSLWQGDRIVAQDMENALLNFVTTGGSEYAQKMRTKIGRDIRELAAVQ